MLPTRTLHELRRRPILRRTISLAGYGGSTVALAYGVVAFWSGDLDAAMASGWPLMGGLALSYVTHEIRAAIRALPARKPDPIES